MATSDDVVRAQARALIRVLEGYHLDRRFGAPTPLWQAVESFGCNGGGAMDLHSIGRKYAGAAAAAFCGGIKHQAPNAALYLALSSFTRVSPPYRFLDLDGLHCVLHLWTREWWRILAFRAKCWRDWRRRSRMRSMKIVIGL